MTSFASRFGAGCHLASGGPCGTSRRHRNVNGNGSWVSSHNPSLRTAMPSFDVRVLKFSGHRTVRVFPLIAILALVTSVSVPKSLVAQDDAGHDTTNLVPGTVFRDCPTCPQMMVVPAGTFIMGSPESEKGRLRTVYDEEGTAVTWTVLDEVELEVEEGQRLVIPEGPQRYVTMERPFAVGVYEVTFDEWDACARAGGCGGLIPENEGWGRGRRPVINVNWAEAHAYVAWLSDETGEAYRLLTEAEWEYVARAGTETARYWEESPSGQCRYANGADATALESNPGWRTVPCSDGYVGTAPVGSYEANAFGLYDVLGNVWEWTQDCWNERYSGAPVDGTAWETGDCSTRVQRGGGWANEPEGLRSANRSRVPVGDRYDTAGFRVARSVR